MGNATGMVVPEGPGYNCAELRSHSSRHKMFSVVDREFPEPIVMRRTQERRR